MRLPVLICMKCYRLHHAELYSLPMADLRVLCIYYIYTCVCWGVSTDPSTLPSLPISKLTTFKIQRHHTLRFTTQSSTTTNYNTSPLYMYIKLHILLLSMLLLIPYSFYFTILIRSLLYENNVQPPF